MADAVSIYGGASDRIRVAGQSVIAIYAGSLGGVIQNPSSPTDQGVVFRVPVQNFGPLVVHGPLNTYALNTLPLNARNLTQRQFTTFKDVPGVEPLFYDFTGPAALQETGTTFILQPGESITVPPNNNDVWVNGATVNHKYAVFIKQPPTQFPPTPIISNWPPLGPTTKLKTINSYLYQQYSDDDNLQLFVESYNSAMQDYIDTFNDINLPIYTQENISGPLLDWVATGLYGLPRPNLSSGRQRVIGPLNTYALNTLTLNTRKAFGSQDIVITSDDLYKRILTWLFFKGDGKIFNIAWLKRRIMRFLNGANGANNGVDQTYPISVSFPGNNVVDIVITQSGSLNIANLLIEAINSGAVELPFQFTYSVTAVSP